MKKSPSFYPVILAGGRGTRFWPLSRKRRAKQLLALDGDRTMIQQTVSRLTALAPEGRMWVISNEDLRDGVARQLPKLRKQQILAEPVGRNTAPAIGLAAFILQERDPGAVIGMFPSDHVIADEKGFRKLLKQAVEIAAAGENIVTLGIEPHRPETGYGYIETGGEHSGALHVRRFTEKPDIERARAFISAGNYYWNSGMFIWGARTLANALREHLPQTAPILEQLATAFGTRKFESAFRRLYPKCENISIDYAVLERRTAKGESASNVFCIPADIGWNDLGSWAALYEHHITGKGTDDGNVIQGDGSFALNAHGNFIFSPKKFVAAVAVSGLVVVETPDALLITTRENAQDVGKVVKHLDEKKLKKLV